MLHTHTTSVIPAPVSQGRKPPPTPTGPRYHAQRFGITGGDCAAELQAMRLNYAVLRNQLDKSTPDVCDYGAESPNNRPHADKLELCQPVC